MTMAPPGNPPPRRRPSTPGRPAAAPARPAAADQTLLGPTPGLLASSTATVTVISGASEGSVFELSGDELVAGRSTDNPISIQDNAISRKHALFRRTPGGWAVSDMGSGNGTQVNGQRIDAETALSTGDVVSLGGGAELRFDDGSGAPDASAAAEDTGEVEVDSPTMARRPAPARPARRVSSPRPGADEGPPDRRRPVRGGRAAEEEPPSNQRKLLVRVGALLAVVMALGIAFSLVQRQRAAARLASEAAEAERSAALAEAFQEAKRLVKQGKYEEAKVKLEEVQAEDPEIKGLTDYLETCNREIPNQKLLLEAKQALDKDDLPGAARALEGIKQTMREGDVKALRDALDGKLVERIRTARGLQASQNDLAKMEQLLAITNEVLAVRPDDRDVPDLKKFAEQSIAYIKNPNLGRPAVVEKPWADVQARFRTGDLTGAMALAQACANKHLECRMLESQLKDFDARNRNVDGLKDDDLWALFELDKKISGGSSSEMSKPIRTRVAANFFLKASQAKTSGNWARATELSRKVLAAEPGNAGAQNIVSEAKNQAREIYQRGYMLRESSPDEAEKLFRDVVTMTPADDEYHQKAKARLQELK